MKCTECGKNGSHGQGHTTIRGKVVIREGEELCPDCAAKRPGNDDGAMQEFRRIYKESPEG